MIPLIPLRPTSVSGFDGVAVSPHVLSTQAAIRTLDRGGNAVDAAIAMNAVQGVVAPETCGIGGDLFALVWPPGTDRPRSLNSSGRAGAGADAGALRRAGLAAIPQRHPAAVPVPGCVDGWLALHGALGSLELGILMEPAIRLATGGFPASRELALAFAGRAEELADEPGASALYSGGMAPLEGQRIVRPTLGTTLERIAEGGRQEFYAGAIGRGICAATDGMLTPDDLAICQADWVDALSYDVFGFTGWTVPPNSQGYISLLALGILERVGLADLDDPLSWHLSVEAYRLAAADRDEVLADPGSMVTDPTELLSRRRVETLADRIEEGAVAALPDPRPASGGTAFMCVVDGNGMGVSLIQSNFHGIGSGRSVAEGGFILHDRGRGFTLTAGHPNELTPGRRPLHTLSPTLWSAGSELACLLGTRGGHNQPQLVTQLAAATLGHGLDPATAMAISRWATDVPSPGAGAPELHLEPGVPAGVVEGLAARGHQVVTAPVPQEGWGPMSIITIRHGGLATGAPDPRVDTAAAGAR